MLSEHDFEKKRKKFLAFGIVFIVLGFILFFAGPILAFLKHPVYGLLSMGGIIFLVPGFIMLTMGIQKPLAEFVAQSAGPIAVESANIYGKKVAKSMAEGIKEGFDENSEIFCKYCGNYIDADSEYCKYCGKKVK